MSRREVLIGLASSSALAQFDLRLLAAESSRLRVNAARLREGLEQLSVFGRPEGGSFADGVNRMAYTDADVAGRQYCLARMQAAGMQPRIDAAGNIFGDREGADPKLKPILFGSHIDSVPSGGNFDGDLGSLAAIEIIHSLQENRIRTKHPLRVVIWANEEGGLVGSSAAAGAPLNLERNYYGLSMAEGMRKIGGDPAKLEQAKIQPEAFHCYLEMHIEQGGTLEKADVPVGVVEGIVSIHEYDVEITGFANHAGTTPMPDRRNALLAAAKLVEAVQTIVTREPGRQVGTVGSLTVHPNAPNVVPGRVKCSVELRDLDVPKIERLGTAIAQAAQEIARSTRTEIKMSKIWNSQPAIARPEVQAEIAAAARDLGLATMRLPSGAGHDAQMMARLGPMGMIFVPSVGGISHSPKELTHWADCANGANVLLQTILRIDRS